MVEAANGGDHDYAAHDQELSGGYLPPAVVEAELDAISKRRQYIKATKYRDRTTGKQNTSGVAISGGGIRSASFGLGALQALHAYSGIEGIDYLSTVSGGGYIGCSLTAAMLKNRGEFPFINPNYDDTDSVRHIRDYSNYLIPHGALDLVTAIGIIGRGLVANAFIVLPVLLFFVWITLLSHPTVESLREPKFLLWNLTDALARLGLPVSDPLWGLHGFWFTAILAAVNILFLLLWALKKSIFPGRQGDSAGGWITASKLVFFVTVISAWFEAQPFILRAMTEPRSYEMGVCASSIFSSECLSAVLHGWFARLTPFLAPVGAVFAFLAKYFGDAVGLARRNPAWQAWIKKILAMAALWFAAITVPSGLWLLYLWLAFIGLGNAQARWIYFGTFVLTGLVAAVLNPNATSLFRLYRDRLSKAFLFDPDPEKRENLDKPNDPHDLQPYEPKLHEIRTNFCPYPIVNAALNIEGSQYANKRGRNADFFVFTPEYTGSDATGYIGSRRIEKEETALDLGTAMAISGAAISDNMGSQTIKPLTFTLAILNVRLGYWLRNPKPILGFRALLGSLLDIRSFLLFKEAFGWITETSPRVYLTDGGHIENLGVYSLLKRRCNVIIAIDSEADPTMSFASFLTLERYARIDLGVIIDLPWQAIRDRTLEIDKAFDEGDKSGSAIPHLPGPHCAAGEIQYGPGENERGILLYVKASLSGDEDDYILDYKRRYRAFPHETTADQFFGDEQLEAYRALGYHIMKGLLTGQTPFAVTPNPGETEKDARRRILSAVSHALHGTPATRTVKSLTVS
jgi:hypothetical protein